MTEQQAQAAWQFVIEKCQRLKNGCNDIRVSRGVIEQHLDDLMTYAENQATALNRLADPDMVVVPRVPDDDYVERVCIKAGVCGGIFESVHSAMIEQHERAQEKDDG